jgi:hypothetical protein
MKQKRLFNLTDNHKKNKQAKRHYLIFLKSLDIVQNEYKKCYKINKNERN